MGKVYMIQIKLVHGEDRWGNMMSFSTNDEAYEHYDSWVVSLPGRDLRVSEWEEDR